MYILPPIEIMKYVAFKDGSVIAKEDVPQDLKKIFEEFKNDYEKAKQQHQEMLEKQIPGNKDFLKQLSSADFSQVKDLFAKANINIDEADVKKVQSALAEGKFDLGDIKNIAGGLFKK